MSCKQACTVDEFQAVTLFSNFIFLIPLQKEGKLHPAFLDEVPVYSEFKESVLADHMYLDSGLPLYVKRFLAHSPSDIHFFDFRSFDKIQPDVTCEDDTLEPTLRSADVKEQVFSP